MGDSVMAAGIRRDEASAPESMLAAGLAVFLVLVLLLSGGWEKLPGMAGTPAYAGAPPRVALTFDDGYGLDHRLLEFLSSEGIRATAFVIGSWAQRNPSLVQEMNALGWDVCNHTQNHAYLTRVPDPLIVAELQACQAVIGSLTGQRWPLFRPPGGFIDDRVRAVAAAAGYTPVMWDLDSGDSRGVDYPVAERAAHLVNAARDGSILLFHFGGKRTFELVVGVVQGLKRRGFCFVTVPELLGWKNMARGGESGPGMTAPARRFHFAEGTTHPGFQEWVLVFNPGREPVKVRAEFYSGEEVRAREYEVPPLRRVSIDVNGELPDRDEVACVLEATGEVVAERTVLFNRGAGFSGGFTAAGSSTPSCLHFFPDGVALEGFEEYLVLFNPNPVEVGVELELAGSGSSRSEALRVPARRRVTLGLKGMAPEGEYSLVVRSEGPLVAEKSRYFIFQDLVTGGSVSTGEASPRQEWSFPGVTVREGYASFLVIYNPCRQPTWAWVSLEGRDGSYREERALIPAGARKTLSLEATMPPGTDCTARVRSLLPVVAEMSAYFRENNVIGGFEEAGIRGSAEEWYFAEGCTEAGFSEWLVLENPWEFEQEVEVSYHTEKGSFDRSYLLPARERVVLDVSTEAGRCWEVCAVVRSSPGVVARRLFRFQTDLGP